MDDRINSAKRLCTKCKTAAEFRKLRSEITNLDRDNLVDEESIGMTAIEAAESAARNGEDSKMAARQAYAAAAAKQLNRL